MRFKGFQDEWERKKLNDLCKMQAGKFVSAAEIIEKPDAHLFPCYGGNGLRGYTKSFNHDGKYPLIGRQGALCGNVTLADGKFYATEHAVVVTLNNDVDAVWMFYLLTHLNLNQYATGQAQPGLSVQNLEKVEATIPKSNYEQQKIATVLSTIDERIQTQNKIIAQLQTLMQGLSEQLFKQQIRFKDDNGIEFPDWKEKKLGEVGEIITGKTPSTKDLDLWKGDIQFVTPTDIDGSKYQYKTERTVKKTEKIKILPSKSIMVTCIASIGKMSLSLSPCITNQQINSIIPYEGYNNEFLYYAILNIIDYIKSTQSSNTLPIVNKTEFSKFEVAVPSIREQIIIASFLSSIDEKIETEKRILQQYENQKKYLLQNMFV